jgi:hypothetical protein
MIDSIEAYSRNVIYIPDETFKRQKNGWLKKLGFNFKISTNGYLNIRGQLSEFWNIINNISDTNFPLIPLNDLNLALQTFEDVFRIRLNDLDLTRLDLALDLNFDIYIDLNNLDILSKNYEVKTFSKLDTSVMFSQKAGENVRLIFYQNGPKGRPEGLRFETRFLKTSVPYKHLSQITEDKIKSIIIPLIEFHLEKVVYKNDIPELNKNLKKVTFSEVRNVIYKYGLLIIDNKSFHQYKAHLKGNGLDRHSLKRLEDERNEVLINSSNGLIQDPIKNILKQLNQLKQ